MQVEFIVMFAVSLRNSFSVISQARASRDAETAGNRQRKPLVNVADLTRTINGSCRLARAMLC